MSEKLTTIERIEQLTLLCPHDRSRESYKIREDILEMCSSCNTQLELMATLDENLGQRKDTPYSKAYDELFNESMTRFQFPLR